MKPEIAKAFAAWRKREPGRGFSATDPRAMLEAVHMYGEDAFAAGAEHGAKAELEACAKHLELCNEHFQRLRDSSRYHETRICCDCMISNLEGRAAELRARGAEKEKHEPQTREPAQDR